MIFGLTIAPAASVHHCGFSDGNGGDGGRFGAFDDGSMVAPLSSLFDFSFSVGFVAFASICLNLHPLVVFDVDYGVDGGVPAGYICLDVMIDV
ncbi:hypothetical protein QVD17_16331 [Tagetes erecta]|uniref:Uncharacterized protein n=1 Tax=Tagetes erecta TaxID=13708 RepID=A0AAD8KQQ6_TARER|nr:hypothetical protein QVD17_16331 [Tagetes erecta]